MRSGSNNEKAWWLKTHHLVNSIWSINFYCLFSLNTWITCHINCIVENVLLSHFASHLLVHCCDLETNPNNGALMWIISFKFYQNSPHACATFLNHICIRLRTKLSMSQQRSWKNFLNNELHVVIENNLKMTNTKMTSYPWWCLLCLNVMLLLL